MLYSRRVFVDLGTVVVAFLSSCCAVVVELLSSLFTVVVELLSRCCRIIVEMVCNGCRVSFELLSISFVAVEFLYNRRVLSTSCIVV